MTPRIQSTGVDRQSRAAAAGTGRPRIETTSTPARPAAFRSSAASSRAHAASAPTPGVARPARRDNLFEGRLVGDCSRRSFSATAARGREMPGIVVRATALCRSMDPQRDSRVGLDSKGADPLRVRMRPDPSVLIIGLACRLGQTSWLRRSCALTKIGGGRAISASVVRQRVVQCIAQADSPDATSTRAPGTKLAGRRTWEGV